MTANQVGDDGLYHDKGEHISQTCVYQQELFFYLFDTHTRFLYVHRQRGVLRLFTGSQDRLPRATEITTFQCVCVCVCLGTNEGKALANNKHT